MLRRTAALSTTLVAAATLATAAPALASTDTAGRSALRVSYVASPPRVHAAHVNVVVPKLTCPKNAPHGHLTVGMSGATTKHATREQWHLQVSADCSHGVTIYRASIGSGDTGIPVKPGDVVAMAETGSSEFTVEDASSGRGEGASSGSSSNPPITRVARLGLTLTGHLTTPLRIVLRDMKINHQPYGSVAHYRELSGSRHGLAIDARAPSGNGTRGVITLRPLS